jgi:hypothetical protein
MVANMVATELISIEKLQRKKPRYRSSLPQRPCQLVGIQAVSLEDSIFLASSRGGDFSALTVTARQSGDFRPL